MNKTSRDILVILSHRGWIECQSRSEYLGTGLDLLAIAPNEGDFVDHLFAASTHDYILCFSNVGRAYCFKVDEIPKGTGTSRGMPIANLLPLEPGERITALLATPTFEDDHFVFMATAIGTVKKTPLSEFSYARKAGIIAVGLDRGDHLIGVALTDGSCDVMLFSGDGKAVRFDESDVRPMGRNARGVRGMMLEDGQRVLAVLAAADERLNVLMATENGYGKCSPIADYRKRGRGTRGLIAFSTSGRNGKVVGAVLAAQGDTQDEIMLITTGGTVIRARVREIPERRRPAQCVQLTNLDDGMLLAGIQKPIEFNEKGDS